MFVLMEPALVQMDSIGMELLAVYILKIHYRKHQAVVAVVKNLKQEDHHHRDL